jgi:hypothetical protein
MMRILSFLFCRALRAGSPPQDTAVAPTIEVRMMMQFGLVAVSSSVQPRPRPVTATIDVGCAMSTKSNRQPLVNAFDELQRSGELRVFGAARLPLDPCNVSPAGLAELTGLRIETFVPVGAPVTRVGAPTLASTALYESNEVVSSFALLAGSAGIALRADPFVDWLRSAPLGSLGGMGVQVTLLAFLIGATGSLALVNWLVGIADSYELRPPPSLRPERREAVVRHEAGHLFACVLLGIPVADVYVDGWRSLLGTAAGMPHVSFHSDALDALRSGEACSSADLDQVSVVMMAGVAAEALYCGSANGGAADGAAIGDLLGAHEALTGEAYPLSVPQQSRWATANAVLLLREHPEAFEALTDALRARSSVGECIEALETAFVSQTPRDREALA